MDHDRLGGPKPIADRLEVIAAGLHRFTRRDHRTDRKPPPGMLSYNPVHLDGGGAVADPFFGAIDRPFPRRVADRPDRSDPTDDVRVGEASRKTELADERFDGGR